MERQGKQGYAGDAHEEGDMIRDMRKERPDFKIKHTREHTTQDMRRRH